MTTQPAGLLAALRNLDSCAVSDALDTLGLPGAVTGLSPRWPAAGVVAGRVRTVTAAPKAGSGASTHIATPLVAIAEPDDVVVIDNHGRVDVSCWGGLLTQAAVQRGIAGVVIDGACRDVAESEGLGLAVFARAAVPVSARGRIVQQDMDARVQICGVSVASHDYVIADVNGVVFVAAEHADRVIALATRIAGREARMADAVRSGRDVQEVMHDSQFPSVTAGE